MRGVPRAFADIGMGRREWRGFRRNLRRFAQEEASVLLGEEAVGVARLVAEQDGFEAPPGPALPPHRVLLGLGDLARRRPTRPAREVLRRLAAGRGLGG